MGHRKHSAPKRGSMAYSPRKRAGRFEPEVRTWPVIDSDKPTLLGFAGYKVGMIHVITVDDREGTPNFGKPLMNSATIIATPPLKIIGFRGYEKSVYGLNTLFDVYSNSMPKEINRKIRIKVPDQDKTISDAESKFDKLYSLNAIVCTIPREAGLEQKKPFIFEIGVGGGDLKARFEYLKSLLGNEVRVNDIFKPGMFIDTSGITKGKGFEGPVTRWGIKRKQHKSRKSVRAVGTLGPWNPRSVMYTVPRAGQRGFHQRTEYNKRILSINNPQENNITPSGGFMHYGVLKSDYLIVRGSVPGTIKRLIKMRYAIRSKAKIIAPNIMEMVVR
ncbi:MAG: 50S ribosomal protein L3 [Candidatus Nitrosothermus koennekii]|nr:MAG: 50S ribosomal protein L3 [Candidatus Nitrosothermus koennekii]